jgi:hypothetical protein
LRVELQELAPVRLRKLGERPQSAVLGTAPNLNPEPRAKRSIRGFGEARMAYIPERLATATEQGREFRAGRIGFARNGSNPSGLDLCSLSLSKSHPAENYNAQLPEESPIPNLLELGLPFRVPSRGGWEFELFEDPVVSSFKKFVPMDRGSFLEGTIRRKRRRNSSPAKQSTITAWFPIDSNKKILPALTEADDREVAFSDRVLRLSPKMKLVQYQLVVGQKQVYLFKDQSGNKKDSFALRDIEKVSMSHQSDNFLIIKLRTPKGDPPPPPKPGIVLVSRRKIQILQILNQQAGGEARGFAVTIADRVPFLHTDQKKYILVSTRTEFGVQSSFYIDTKGEAPEPTKPPKTKKMK